MNKKRMLLTGFLGATSMATLIIAGLIYWGQPREAYVNLNEVYDHFELKKELEGQLDGIIATRTHILDSLKLDLNQLGRQLETASNPSPEAIGQFRQKRDQLMAKEQQFQQEEEQIAAQFQEQIWNQLNQYVQDFGEEKGFDFIHGADGSGALMYARNNYDVSDEVVEFVNRKYKG